MTDELLTIQDIANLYRCDYRTARDVKVKLVGFPKPVPGSSPRIPLWLREDVRRFIRGEPIKIRTNPASSNVHV